MPQMAPLLWLNLFLFFSVIFLFFLIINFFIKPPFKMEFTPEQPKPAKLFWKW
uniref:ATP synthase F0 subunit 8 n=1 Tax=Alvinocaris longirostris TaxID=337181 RepID=M1ETG5_9EUCA|nr:ATP synthase F0 subunit 8 [Alvinocaris longirostris]AEX32632.1 ATP synthase F0 subunit 8 [Alvinocaris longirostris]WQG15282.1 ATP synthase F0 subunit 8 [Alvinocaris longirostris]BAO52798.1 ATP synthase F0 subunit 8 [Alvinocaris longirostris]